ncbi:MAG: LytTR family DNA-binding domain-containing protein [Erysipelotrichaceae bacterium]
MLKVAIITKKPAAKDIIFSFGELLTDWEWTFRYFNKISDYAKVEDINFDILVLSAEYNTKRIYDSLIKNRKDQILIFVMDKKPEVIRQGRMFYIDSFDIETSLEAIKHDLLRKLITKNEYHLDYNGINILLAYDDILYIEKVNKNLVFHTKRGLFEERASLIHKADIFIKYGFIRTHASFMVNMKYVVNISQDVLHLVNKECLPIARSRAKDVLFTLQQYKK